MPEPVTPPRRVRPMPVFGCLAFIVLAAVAGALAVGGSFWGWIVLGALILAGGTALAIYLVRKNTRVPPAAP